MATTAPEISRSDNALERWFRISERGSTLAREIRGGLVTFFTMAYIVVLNPLIIGTQADSTGGFLGGAAAVQGIARAIKLAHGSTNGAKLASIMVKFHKVPTISGKISFSAGLHTVFGRAYRVIEVNDNEAKYVASITASSPAKIGR
jgi:xanthine/uracil/vitamin C permease (AzgA family)